jgi:hypothetical protein
MKRAILAVCSVLLALAPVPILAQTAPPNTASEPVAQPQPLPQAESFEFLKSLNEAGKIFHESYFFPLSDLIKKVALKPENCFGVRLANGLRLVGESSGGGYGVHGTVTDKDGKKEALVLIGVLHAEFPFAIEEQPLPAGPYMVLAYQDALELVGQHESKTYYDSFRRKQIPEGVTKKLPLKVVLPEALLAEKATEIPRFSLAVEKGAIVLALHGNTWKLVPR